MNGVTRLSNICQTHATSPSNVRRKRGPRRNIVVERIPAGTCQQEEQSDEQKQDTAFPIAERVAGMRYENDGQHIERYEERSRPRRQTDHEQQTASEFGKSTHIGKKRGKRKPHLADTLYESFRRRDLSESVCQCEGESRPDSQQRAACIRGSGVKCGTSKEQFFHVDIALCEGFERRAVYDLVYDRAGIPDGHSPH